MSRNIDPSPVKVRETICNECPFRRAAWAGWLGANDPESFVTNALTEHSVACHMMVDQTLKRADWEKAEDAAPRCRGALIFMRNIAKMPRVSEMAALVRTVPADRVNVFTSPREFVDFHNAAVVKSWSHDPPPKVKTRKQK